MVDFILWLTIWELQKQKVKSIFSVEGYSLKFQVLNFTGFLFYSIYSSMGYFGNDPSAGTVDLSDIAFGYHALLMVTITGI